MLYVYSTEICVFVKVKFVFLSKINSFIYLRKPAMFSWTKKKQKKRKKKKKHFVVIFL